MLDSEDMEFGREFDYDHCKGGKWSDIKRWTHQGEKTSSDKKKRSKRDL